ncbi:MAG: hypothetical protein GY719_16215 [bacterium]|nr:hypothetical protein [bacterium]
MTSRALNQSPPARWLQLLTAALLAAACGAPESVGKKPDTDGERTVVVSHSVDMQGVNELTTQSTAITNALLYHAFFLQLVEEQADYQDGPPTFEPQLAESYEFSEDRLRLTFHLRPDVVWSDGVPVTAEDVRWTWQGHIHPDVPWGLIEAKKHITDVEVVDPHTAVFHFSKAYAAQLQDAVIGVILPKHAWGVIPFEEWRENTTWFRDHMVVNGPFALESWEPQQRYVLRRNKKYFDSKLPKVDRIVFEVIPEENSRLALLRSGKAHLVEIIAPQDAARIEADPDLKLLPYIPRVFFFLTWNVSRPLFADKEVRQALTMAIDRQEIVDSIHYGYANVSYSPFPSNHWAYNKNLQPWPYDPGRAKEMLARAGWTDSDGDGILDRDGQPFSFELVTNAESQVRLDALVMIQDHLKRVGVDVRTRSMEFNALLDPLNAHDFDAAIQALALDTSLNTSFFLHTSAIDDGFNWGAYSNPEMDRLIDQTAAEVDPLAAKPIYDQLQALLHEEAPLTFLYETQRLCAASKNLHDVDPNSISTFFNLRRWRLEDTE